MGGGSKMDTVWTQLPINLTDRICNLLPSLHPLHPRLKEEIEGDIGRLILFASQFRNFRHADRWEIVYTSMIEWNQYHTDPPVIIPAEGRTVREYCEHVWRGMTEEGRDGFITEMSNTYTEWAEELDRREAHWEDVNEARLAREERLEQGWDE
jgi:hypothetical protein